MALKPRPPPWEVLQQVGELLGGSGLGSEMDKSARALAQSALARLDVVSREEFDAQADILQRTRARVEELEQELEQLGRELEGISSSD
jgi:BMFP domain-containing protein YqiC